MATTLTDIWKMIRGYMKPELTETTINTWFDDEVEAVGMENLTFYLACDNDFKRDMIRQMFIPNIQLALQRVFSSDFAVEILTFAERDKYLKEREERKNRKPDPFTSGEFTFENFVVGESNKLAYAAAHAVADEPAQHYNPLFIYGDSGLGKTHLIYAIAHEVRIKQPDAKIVYVKGDDFINEFIELIRANRGSEFRAKYRDADLFFVDDVQFVAGKEQVQNEFFHTFNTLYESKKQIVLTSDRPPQDMSLLDDRLRTRFEWGLMVDVQPPDFETRLAIITNTARQWKTTIDDETALYIAENVTANVRQIEGVMNKILAYRELLDKRLSDEELSRAMSDFIRKNITTAPSAGEIISETCRYFGVDENDMRGPKRTKEITLARQAAIYLIRTLIPQYSTNDIGKEFGNRDHATILYALSQVEVRIRSEADFDQKIKEIKTNILSRH